MNLQYITESEAHVYFSQLLNPILAIVPQTDFDAM